MFQEQRLAHHECQENDGSPGIADKFGDLRDGFIKVHGSSLLFRFFLSHFERNRNVRVLQWLWLQGG